MGTTKIVGIVLLVLGAILLYFGINATNAPMEQLGETLTGQYSDQTMIYLIGGGIAAALGVVALIKK